VSDPVQATPAAASVPGAAPLRIAVAGASGRMGRMLVEAVLDAPDLALASALDVAGSPQLGQDAAGFLGRASGVAITADLDAALAGAQVLIDFTRPEGTLRHLEACADKGVALVIGTTGFTDAQKATIRASASRTAVFMAPNMSVGVNVVMRLLEQAARALSEGYDIEIIEAHHRNKVDAPSGTALQMGEVVAKALGRRLADCAVFGREGVTGVRDPSTIGFATVRGGDIIGDHTVLFAGTGERIEISHKSSSRATYAQGSLRAARFLARSGPGLYDMNDVLGLN
jgi:4-hydroxy-tetrahydrodipicolinate reductase